MIRIFKFGPHSHRTPLSYPALTPLWDGFVELVDRPERADLYLFAHTLDVSGAPRALVEDWRRRRRPVVILSEEPFWDTIWGRRPLDRRRVLDTAWGALPVIQLNHHTSTIFDFDRIPYYLLTNHRFANVYAARFYRNARRGAADWRESFSRRPHDLVFMFERRPEPHHDVAWDEGNIIGLCAWRTRLAESCSGPGVKKLGRSWQGGASRFEIGNWHLDKITRLDDRARTISAVENTHQPNYVTEKFFDAFACGARPLYFASSRHRIHEFALPEASWENLFGLSPEAAAGCAVGAALPPDFFDAYAEAQNRLESLFADPANWVEERARLARALRQELEQVLG